MPQLCTFGASSARGFGLTEETGPGLPDDQFNLTTLLLPGNGTNGAQNNTFLDSSTNNLTITRNGNTTQGTFSPFSFGGGTAQANGYYSGYFDGSGDYLSLPDNAAFTVGTGNLTIEAWIYVTSISQLYQGIMSGRVNTTNYPGLGLTIDNGQLLFTILNNGNGLIDSATVPLNQWVHVAGVRSGTNAALFVNGQRKASAVNSENNTLNSMVIGRYYPLVDNYYFSGYISNARLLKGTAAYDPTQTSITVPTSPLTNITNTSLLTCQSSQFIDNSTNAFAITSFGNALPVQNNPFGMTAWSGYFDGTGDYLTFPELNIPASTSFTIEFFVSWNAVPSTLSMFISEDGGSASKYLTYNNNGTLQAQMGVSAATVASCPFSLASNVWYHIAFVRNVNTVTIYVNGVAQTMTQATQSAAFLDAGTINYIGRWGGSPEYAFNGQMSNFRAVVGTAVYTSNFTPPTAPLTAISGTQLLTCQSSTFIDNSPSARAITVNGNSYTSTLNNPFGSIVNYTTPPLQAWSNYFNGGSDRLSNTSASVMDVGTGNFTIEMWVFLTSTANQMFFEGSGNAGLQVVIESGVLFGGLSGIGAPVSYTLPSGFTNTWHHIAYVREGTGSNQVSLYVDGIRRAQGTLSNSVTTTGFQISRTSTYLVYGYISNLRVVKNSAVYTGATITVPTAPLTAIANTSLLTCQSNGFVDNSINRSAITVSGSTSVQAFSPFNPDAAYSTTSVGGSGYFDGTGDSLSTSSAALATTGDLTLEAWVYVNSVPNYAGVFSMRNSVNSDGMAINILNTGYLDFSIDGSSPGEYTGTLAPLRQWFHVALVRSGSSTNNVSCYLNGSRVGQFTSNFTTNGASNAAIVGRYYANGADQYNLNGYISSLRYVVGTALYSGTGFTVPTAPFTAITNTQVLLNFTNAGIPDATAKGDWETVGNAQISTAQSKFGGSSMYFDGSGDALANLASSQYSLFDFGTGDFTIEFWFYCINTTSGMVYTRAVSGHNLCAVYVGANSTDRVTFFAAASGGGTAIQSAGTPAVSTWNHAAIVRQNGTVTVYLNGTGGTPTSNTTNITAGSTYVPTVGAYYHGGISYPFAGYIDDLRVTKGYARYTTNFTPPTQAFPLY